MFESAPLDEAAAAHPLHRLATDLGAFAVSGPAVNVDRVWVQVRSQHVAELAAAGQPATSTGALPRTLPRASWFASSWMPRAVAVMVLAVLTTVVTLYGSSGSASANFMDEIDTIARISQAAAAAGSLDEAGLQGINESAGQLTALLASEPGLTDELSAEALDRAHSTLTLARSVLSATTPNASIDPSQVAASLATVQSAVERTMGGAPPATPPSGQPAGTPTSTAASAPDATSTPAVLTTPVATPATATPMPTATPTATPTVTPTPTATPTATPTPTVPPPEPTPPPSGIQPTPEPTAEPPPPPPPDPTPPIIGG